jgi:hypothetical protein
MDFCRTQMGGSYYRVKCSASHVPQSFANFNIKVCVRFVLIWFPSTIILSLYAPFCAPLCVPLCVFSLDACLYKCKLM